MKDERGDIEDDGLLCFRRDRDV